MKSKNFSYLAAIAVAFSVSLAVTAQDDGVSVYVCGAKKNAEAVYWKNGTEIALSSEASTTVAHSIYVSGNDVYIAGEYWTSYWDSYYKMYKSLIRAGYWKNGDFIPLTHRAVWNYSKYEQESEVFLGISYISDPDSMSYTPYANSIYVSDGNVYVAGRQGKKTKTAWTQKFYDFLTQTTTYRTTTTEWLQSTFVATVWKNGTANMAQQSDNSDAGLNINNSANSIFVSEAGDVYVAGCEGAGVTYVVDDLVAKYWKNGVPTTLTDGTYKASANSIFVSGDDVYVAVTEDIDTDDYASKPRARLWKNGVLTDLSNGSDSEAKSVFVSGSDVYVAGQGPGGAGYWKNGEWTGGVSGTATSIYVFNNDVYVAGNVGGYSYGQAVYWKNGQEIILDNNNNGSFATCIFVTQAGQDVTAIKTVDNASFHACFINNTLRIESPNAELINIYSITGSLLYSGKKNEGAFEIPFSPIQGVYIIKGSASGTIKIAKE